ncbi:hypothetical protein LAWASA_996 [Lawsonibacter asaccharolyticus]|nr:hypothetical protein LAWASA_996 [Lawsonibacter asaccharolyticus]
MRRKGGQVRRLGREPQRLKRQAGHRARSKGAGPVSLWKEPSRKEFLHPQAAE